MTRGAVMDKLKTDPLLTVQELAEYIGYEVTSVYNFKQNGRGPKMTKIGARVRYYKSDVDAWIAAQNKEEIAS